VAPSPTPPAVCAAGNDISDRIQQALIRDGYGGACKAAVNLSHPLARIGDSGWHTWGLRWTPTDLTFYYDDRAIWSTTGPISRRSEYMILSSEVGVFFAGAIPPTGYGSRATSTTSMQVDDVRVWERPNAAANTPAAAAAAPPALGDAPSVDATSAPGNARAIPAAPAPARRRPCAACTARGRHAADRPALRQHVPEAGCDRGRHGTDLRAQGGDDDDRQGHAGDGRLPSPLLGPQLHVQSTGRGETLRLGRGTPHAVELGVARGR
jgi:hypothetical protein